MNEDWMDWARSLLQETWAQDLVLAAVTLVVAILFLNGFLAFLHRQAKRTTYLLDDVLIDALHAPARMLIWLLVLGFAVRPLLALGGIDAYLGEAWLLVLLGAITWFLIRLVQGYLDEAMRRAGEQGRSIDTDLYAMGARILKLVIIVLAGLAALHTFGISIAGILTFGGIGGLVVGFAAKDFLENFFGALMIHLDRPFRTGDWIRIRDTDIEGVVEEIRWRQTRIRTFSRNRLFIPNSLFLSSVIENPSQMTHRRVQEVIGLRYDDFSKMPAIIQDVDELLHASPDFDSEMPMLVRFETFGASSVDFFLQCYSPQTDREPFTASRQKLLFDVAEIIERHGAEIAFPTQTLHLHQEKD